MRKLTTDEIGKKRPGRRLPRHESFPLTVIADNIRSLYNVGSIFRTSDGAMVKKLILTGFTPKPPRREIEKTALGATTNVPWEYIRSPVEAIRAERSAGSRILCLEQTDSSVPYTTVRRSDFPLCLVIGNEVSGVSPEVIDVCDGAMEIPMFGIKHSLNVAVAYGIVLFELLKCWNQGGDHQSNDLV